ncbi:MAG: hypothetical protein KF760_13010 [Candidatus Eremiobacteraeota bacterium]|nr:hypothetical protein [Candidatus Eremiobacteraeota bacterium]
MLMRLLLLLLCAWPALADTPKFRTIPLDVRVNDKFDRPFEVQDNTAYIGVRLAQDEKQTNKEVSQYETLSCAGIEYPRQTQEYLKFAVQGGVAKVQFVVFQDNKAPVDYELKLIENNTIHDISPSIWQIGTESTSGEVKAEGIRAPHSSREVAIIAAFTVVGLGLGYWLLGRVLFARMLRQRHMEVGSALTWSNLLVLFSWALVGLGVAIMVLFPVIVWQKLYWIYVLVPAGYALVVSTIYGAGHLFTRS